MVRNLYRFYLYAVFIALLIFTAVITGQLLNALLSLTPLHGSYGNVASQAEVTQALVFAGVTWVIAGVLVGLHYWLIRRDIKDHPDAAASAIRSFFLNITEAVALTTAVPLIGFSVLGYLASYAGANVAGSLAYALPALALFVLLELERRRTKEAISGAALAFQRFHFYGVQIFLLIYLTFACFNMIRLLVDGLFFSGNVAFEQCRSAGGSDCSRDNPLFPAITLLWFSAFWIGYGWLLRNDHARMLRLILHGASFAYGIGFILSGIFFGAELLLAPLFKLPVALNDVLSWSPPYDFVSPLILGILVAGVYHFWLKKAAEQRLIDRPVLSLTENAIVEVLSAASFWWGCGYLLYNLFQMLMPAPYVPDTKSWLAATAFAIAGLGYIPSAIYLYRRSVADAQVASGPRRGVVFALLGGGILALAIGGATALYACITSLFGSAIANWQQVAYSGLAAFIVGIVVVGIYLWSAFREHLLVAREKQTGTPATSPDVSAATMPSPADTTNIEEILDALLSNKITRDEAAERLRALNNVSMKTEDHKVEA